MRVVKKKLASWSREPSASIFLYLDETTFFLKTLINFYPTALYHVPQDSVLHTQKLHNLKSNKTILGAILWGKGRTFLNNL